MRIPFAEWAPDIAELDAGVAAVARNVYPGANSYLPVNGPATYSQALPAAPRGLALAEQQDGNFVVFAGTADKLYRLDTSTLAWTEVGSGFSLPADEIWSFAQFGTKLIAVNVNDDPQVFDVEVGSSFAALGGAPPRARYVDVHNDYVVLAGLVDDPFALAWSGTNDATSWTPGVDNSDRQSFGDGGRVQNIAAAAGMVLQERGARQMIYTPGAASGVFQFVKLEQAKGCVAPYSVVKFGSHVAWLAEDGFWLDDVPISADKVGRYFLDNVNQQRLFSVLGTFDPLAPRFYWAYHTGDGEAYDQILCFNWKTGRWSEIAAELLLLGGIATPGRSLEGLDALFAAVEDVSYSLDSRIWLGGRPTFAAFASDRKLAFFEGATLEATLETGDRQLADGRRALVRSVRPVVDSSAALARVGKRERLADTRIWSAESAMEISGECPLRSSGRYHRFRVRLPAGTTWTHAQGVEVTAAGQGRR